MDHVGTGLRSVALLEEEISCVNEFDTGTSSRFRVNEFDTETSSRFRRI